jgi:hypothetical protein
MDLMNMEVQGLAIRGIEVAKANICLISNNSLLIYAPEYFEGVRHPSLTGGEGWLICSQMANFQIRPIDYRSINRMDGCFYIFDYKGVKPSISIVEDGIIALGNWSKLEKETVDKRYTLLGNQGLLFRYVLTILEKKYNIYNFHACALYNEESNEMLLALGEKGSGKSALLLSALDKGLYDLFASEIVHVKITDEGIAFYKGSLRNNVRAGHLLYDFPGITEKLGLEFSELKDPWRTKVQISLKKYEAKPNVVVNPKINVILPRIEEYNKVCQFHYIKDMRIIKSLLMENLSDKIRSLALIYETVPVDSLDSPDLIRRRLAFVEKFMEEKSIIKVVSVFASPQNCLEGWI